jgi:hypothetical protein
MPKKIFVIVKGSVADATLAANERAIVLHHIKPHKVSDGHAGEVHAFVDAECHPELVQWFCQDRDDAVYAPGALLWYSDVRDFGQQPAQRRA